MARHSSKYTEPQKANLTDEQIRKGISRIQKRLDDLEQFNPLSISERRSPEVRALETAIDETLSEVFGHNTIEYIRYQDAAQMHEGMISYSTSSWIDARAGGHSRGADYQELQENLKKSKARSIGLLQQAIRGLTERLEDNTQSQEVSSSVSQKAEPSRKVFIVHGHNMNARESVARFVEKIGLEAVVLDEQPNQGRTIIEKVEKYSDVGFAIVLLTPDDVGSKAGEQPLRPRPRQNVILELGYFIGRLGRSKVCALYQGEMELPSDYSGVVWEKYDDLSGSWKIPLSRELKAAGFEIDWNQVMDSQ